MRYHVVWALALKPELIAMFYAEPDRTGFYNLLDSLSEAERADPGFCARLELIARLIFSDLEQAWKLLERAPGSVRQHPLFQLRQAMAYAQDTDYKRALPIYLRLCEMWPHDAVGFANACDCFMKLGQWRAAEAVLDVAPKCYETFHLCYAQRENLRQRNLDCSPSKTMPFRGQRDLGGLFMPQPPPASSFPQKDLLTDGELPPLKSQPIVASSSENFESKDALMSLMATASESKLIMLPDGSVMRSRAHLSAAIPPIKDFGKKIEQSKAEYRKKHGDKLPPVH